MTRHHTILLSVFLALIIGVGAFGSMPVQAASTAVWMTVDTNHPAAGCSVDTGIEVRRGGYPVPDAKVTIILSDDGSPYTIDASTGYTGANGVVWLSFSTAGAPGAKTWLEVRVNDVYMGGRTIWIDGNSCSGAPSVLDLSGDVPVVTNTWTGTTSNSASGTFIPYRVVTYNQQRPLSCEYAAVQIATTMLGYTVTEYQMENVTPLSANPHWGYRGDINGTWGGTVDYGIYAEALIPGLNYYGFDATSMYGDRYDLQAAIDRGNPVIVWMGMKGDQSHNEYTSDGTRYQVTAYQHVMVAYGYDADGVYLSDPGSGNTRYYDWGTFNWMWKAIDGMMLIIGE